MRRRFERGAKGRLSSWWAMADSVQNTGSWTVSGSKEAMEVSKNFKDLRECGVGNIALYSAANVPFPAIFSSTFTSFLVQLVDSNYHGKNWASSTVWKFQSRIFSEYFQNISIPRTITFPYYGIEQNYGNWIFQHFYTIFPVYTSNKTDFALAFDAYIVMSSPCNGTF